MAERISRVLTIAGSDSGGGAGIQADLKAFARCGVHGMTAITAVTCQNTVAVEGVTVVPPEAIVGQVRAVATDIGVDAVKIGMLGTVETIEAVAQALELVPDAPIVLDPVMVAESGAPLLEPEARSALVSTLVPRAAVATPNLAEARALVEIAGIEDVMGEAMTEVREAGEAADAEGLARAVHSLGPASVIVTGGHGTSDETTDLYFDGERVVAIHGPRHPGGAAHGSGCTHSSALAAHLALGLDPLAAARAAKRIASEAVRDGLRGLGAGSGPVDALGIASRSKPRA